jgi:YD repeat-containing protein
MRRRGRTTLAPRLELLEARRLLTDLTVSVTASQSYVNGTGAYFTLSANSTTSGIPGPDVQYQVQATPNPNLNYLSISGNSISTSGLILVQANGSVQINVGVTPNASGADEQVTFSIIDVTPCQPQFTVGSPSSATITFHNPAPSQPPPPPPPDPTTAPFCDCSGPLAASGNPGNGTKGGKISGAGIAYGSGGADPRSPALLASDGFGGPPMGLNLGWTNLAGYGDSAAGAPFGSGMVDPGLPSLRAAAGGGLVAVASAGNGIFFANNAGTYSARFAGQDTLAANGSGGYDLTQTDGMVFHFFGFGSGVPAAQRGRLSSYADAAGNTTTASYNTSGQLTAIGRGDGTLAESYAYTYNGAGLVSNVALKRGLAGGTLATVRQAALTYYDGTQPHGNAGDLLSETLQDAAGTSLGTTYFRYYTAAEVAGGANGYVGGLKYQLTPQSYARLAANLTSGTTPETATDAQLAPYADQYYEYNSGRRVTKTVVQGAGCSCTGSTGQGAYTYAYTTSANANGTNSWTTKTVETLPDGNQNIVYTNSIGEVMLEAFSDISDAANTSLNGLVWATYHRFDADGREVLTAQPSAVAITNLTSLAAAQANADLVGYNSTAGTYAYLSSGSGVIDLTDYGTSTTATTSAAGDVLGYVKDHKVQHGYAGTPILLDGMQYVNHADAAGAVIHPVASSTAYRNTDGTGAETTSIAYTWYTGTNLVLSTAVSAPVVSSTQNGPGTADVTTTYFDAVGRATWVKGAGGFLHYAAYDNATGAVVKSIVDVDASQTSQFAGLPSGWATPTGGGLNLVTTYQVDGLGRATKAVDPLGHVTFAVYDDPDHEVRAYRGWSATTGTATGPTEVVREDWAGSYTETLTTPATPAVSGTSGSYAPTGAESIAGILTLSRRYTDKGDRPIEDDEYFSLAGVSAYSTVGHLGTLGTNYYATTYGYDHLGRRSVVTDAVGTITINKFDAPGRPYSTYVGTDATNFWTGGSGSNMILVSRSQYDGDGVGDGNLTRVAQYPNGTSADDRVTRFAYDWRDRLVASKSGVQGTEGTATHRPIFFQDLDNLGEVTAVSQYDGDGVTLSSTKPSAGLLRAYSTAAYDDQGRPYRLQQYSVGASTGALSTYALTTDTYYDHRGHAIAVYAPGGQVTKQAYDGAGRAVDVWVTDGSGGTAWADASTVDGDRVLTQARTAYDAAGNAILVTTADRNHDAPDGLLGDLIGAGTAAPQVGDSNFEDIGIAPGGYYYVPSGSSWTFTGLAGVASNGGGFTANNPDTPDGAQVNFLQQTGSFSQTISGWAGGTYKLSFLAAQRDRGATNDAQDFQVLVDNVVVGTFTPTDGTYRLYTTGNFAVSAGSHTITFLGLNTAGGDNTALIDGVFGVAARVSYTARYYDAANRLTDVVDVGTLGGIPYARPSTPPARSDTALVTSYQYDQAGRVNLVTDPRGIMAETEYDMLGRTTKTIAAYTFSGPAPYGTVPTDSTNQGTTYTYDGLGHVLTVTAVMPTGTASQTTTYVYGVTVAGGSAVNSNDLLAAVVQPDPATGAYPTSGNLAANRVAYTRNALGQATGTVDPLGTAHAYSYDVLGRPLADSVTALGTGVDGAVRRLETAYDTAGRAYLYTSYDAASGGNVVNQVRDAFNGLGQLTDRYQEHGGAVNTSSTPAVRYAYAEMAGGQNNSRLVSMTYPNGRVLDYVYNTGLDSTISRLSAIADDVSGTPGTVLESYRYLGLGTIVERKHPQPQVDLTYVRQAGDAYANADGGDQYIGLDRFGRVVDQDWFDTSHRVAVARYQYGYDRAGNALYRADLRRGREHGDRHGPVLRLRRVEPPCGGEGDRDQRGGGRLRLRRPGRADRRDRLGRDRPHLLLAGVAGDRGAAGRDDGHRRQLPVRLRRLRRPGAARCLCERHFAPAQPALRHAGRQRRRDGTGRAGRGGGGAVRLLPLRRGDRDGRGRHAGVGQRQPALLVVPVPGGAAGRGDGAVHLPAPGLQPGRGAVDGARPDRVGGGGLELAAVGRQ